VADRIILGHIATVHGIRGEVVIKSYTQDPADIGAYGPLSCAASQRTFVIEQVRVTPKGVVARIKGVRDRTSAEGLRGIALTVARTALPVAADDELQLTGAKQTELVPFTDPVVPTIDVKARRLTVIMPVMVGEPEPADAGEQDPDAH
jgi:ribosomal 30S subunit maturation factor RimM